MSYLQVWNYNLLP